MLLEQKELSNIWLRYLRDLLVLQNTVRNTWEKFHALSLQGFTTVIALKPSLDLGSESGLISLTC